VRRRKPAGCFAKSEQRSDLLAAASSAGVCDLGHGPSQCDRCRRGSDRLWKNAIKLLFTLRVSAGSRAVSLSLLGSQTVAVSGSKRLVFISEICAVPDCSTVDFTVPDIAGSLLILRL
jgi:hypothetical protein